MFSKPNKEGFFKYAERPGDPKQIVQVSRNKRGSLKATTREGEVFLVAYLGGEWGADALPRPSDWPADV